MFNEIWDRVFYFLNHPRDLLNARQTSVLWWSLIERHLIVVFDWYKFHLQLIQLPTVNANQSYTPACDVYSFTNLGANFRVYRGDSFRNHYLEVVDYLGNKRMISFPTIEYFVIRFSICEIKKTNDLIMCYRTKMKKNRYFDIYYLFNSKSMKIVECKCPINDFDLFKKNERFVRYNDAPGDIIKLRSERDNFATFSLCVDVYQANFECSIQFVDDNYKSFTNVLPCCAFFSNTFVFRDKDCLFGSNDKLILINMVASDFTFSPNPSKTAVKFDVKILYHNFVFFDEIFYMNEINSLALVEINHNKKLWKVVDELKF